MHVLALGVLAHVQAGRNADARKRITTLHYVLDSGVLDRSGIRDGVVEVCDYDTCSNVDGVVFLRNRRYPWGHLD